MKKRRRKLKRSVKLVITLFCLALILSMFSYIRRKQDERLYNTYTTLIVDGEVIEMTQKELIDYYKNK